MRVPSADGCGATAAACGELDRCATFHRDFEYLPRFLQPGRRSKAISRRSTTRVGAVVHTGGDTPVRPPFGRGRRRFRRVPPRRESNAMKRPSGDHSDEPVGRRSSKCRESHRIRTVAVTGPNLRRSRAVGCERQPTAIGRERRISMHPAGRQSLSGGPAGRVGAVRRLPATG